MHQRCLMKIRRGTRVHLKMRILFVLLERRIQGDEVSRPRLYRRMRLRILMLVKRSEEVRCAGLF